ncbi:ABC transporter permease [Microlunatus sp. GCM10028923]|uniref:ABC transporter permease n=1 Tax=Microlunatus sp. GCM10028923 TaxID=3273400 RepID=UPI0036168B17
MVLNFMLPRLIPGDPAQQMIQNVTAKTGRPPGPLELQSIFARYGNPEEGLLNQFSRYLGETLQGNLGLSIQYYPVPVVDLVGKAIPWTVYLGLASTVLGWVIGTVAGARLGWRPGGRFDTVLTPVAMFVNNIPPFFLGLLLVWFVAYQHGWLPAAGAYNTELEINLLNPTFLLSVLIYSILPLTTLIIVGFANWMFTMRNMMITTVNEDYVQLARAKGLSPTQVRTRYAARNAILPNFTGLAQAIGFTLTSVVLAESVFVYPGVGGLLGAANTERDYPVIQGIMLIIIAITLVFNFLADSVYTLLDPRIQES